MIPRRETHAGRGCVPIRNTAPDSNPLLGPFLAQLLDESWKSYRKSRRRIRPRGGRRHVHRARISARRLLTTLDLLAGLDGGHGLLEALRALARQFSALGKLRDTQVQLRELNELAISDSERRPLRRSLKKKERRRCRSLTASDVDDIGPQIEKASARLASGPATAASGRRLKSGLNRALRADLERVNTLLPRGPGDLSRMHQARVAIKRYRYLIELLRPILSGVDPGAIKRLRACQARMGQENVTVQLLDFASG